MPLKITEAGFLGQVTTLAEYLGWRWVHFRPAKTKHGWRTPVSGPLGKGWPDLILVRAKDHRLMLVELKRDEKSEWLEGQKENLLWLERALVVGGTGARIEVYVWYEADFTNGNIQEVLT